MWPPYWKTSSQYFYFVWYAHFWRWGGGRSKNSFFRIGWYVFFSSNPYVWAPLYFLFLRPYPLLITPILDVQILRVKAPLLMAQFTDVNALNNFYLPPPPKKKHFRFQLLSSFQCQVPVQFQLLSSFPSQVPVQFNLPFQIFFKRITTSLLVHLTSA